MRHVGFEPAQPLDTGGMAWIPTGPGKSFCPLRFAADGWSELMRLEPGSGVALYRHTGEVHAFRNSSPARLEPPDDYLDRFPGPLTAPDLVVGALVGGAHVGAVAGLSSARIAASTTRA